MTRKKMASPAMLSEESSESETEFLHSDSSFSVTIQLFTKKDRFTHIVLSPSTMSTNWTQML